MECKYCKKILSSVSSLNLHQKKTQYCLKIQGLKGIKGKHICEYCNTDFNHKSTLKTHYISCPANTEHFKELRQKFYDIQQENLSIEREKLSLEEKIKNLEKDKKDLQNRYDALASLSVSRPTTTNNTTNNTLNLSVFNKTQDDIKRIVNENYNKEYLLEGQKGVARFTLKHVINSEEGKSPMYVVTDKSRGNGKYRSSESEVVTDNKMTGLTRKVYPSIKERAIDIANEEDAIRHPELMDGYREVYEMGDDNTIFRGEMVRWLSNVSATTPESVAPSFPAPVIATESVAEVVSI
jgi:hypothetical protein